MMNKPFPFEKVLFLLSAFMCFALASENVNSAPAFLILMIIFITGFSMLYWAMFGRGDNE